MGIKPICECVSYGMEKTNIVSITIRNWNIPVKKKKKAIKLHLKMYGNNSMGKSKATIQY